MAASFSDLDPQVQKLEFKVTVLSDEEPAVFAEIGRTGATPVPRKVYFYDTPGLALADRNLFLRARVTEGDEDDSTVKLRPVPLPGIPAGWAATADVRIEVDVVGARRIPSAKLDHDPERGRVERVARGELEPGKLFSKDQEALVERELDDLEVLGPVVARKWELPPAAFPHELSVEEWTLPDGSHFVELSFKVEPPEAASAQQAFHAFLDRLGIGHDGDPDPKTRKVLEFFAVRSGRGR